MQEFISGFIGSPSKRVSYECHRKINRQNMGEEDAMLQGQAEILHCMFASIDTMALKCVVQLGIPDIINSHGRPITVTEIMDSIINAGASSPNIGYLSRIMRFLVHKRIFSARLDQKSGNTLYSLTYSSKWLLTKDSNEDLTLAPYIKMQSHRAIANPMHDFSDFVKDGDIAYLKSKGSNLWNLASKDPNFNRVFNNGMACTAKIIVKAILVHYKDRGFKGVGCLVDVAGGTGTMISEIVKAHPQVRGINYDLPHVVATAPSYPGVEHVGGDIFVAVPCADAVIMKWILHDWNDEDCVKILKNCRKAIPKKTGKVIIVDFILRPDGNGLFDSIGMAFDLSMMSNCIDGKERNEDEWKKLLIDGGFPRFKFIQIPTFLSIIEAYPE